MKEELVKALDELNGLIYKGLREENRENKLICAMHIALQLGQIKMMVQKLDHPTFTAKQVMSVKAAS